MRKKMITRLKEREGDKVNKKGEGTRCNYYIRKKEKREFYWYKSA